MHVCLCVLTTVVEEAHVRQNEPPLLPQLHACTVLNESKVISETKYNNYRESYYFSNTHILIFLLPLQVLTGSSPAFPIKQPPSPPLCYLFIKQGQICLSGCLKQRPVLCS